MICDREPERPGATNRALTGDLDTIVLKALRKAPEQRYRSVEEFANDIQRYLDGLPVVARNPTLHYRTARFVGRHRESAATAIIALILLGAIGLWEWHRKGNAAPVHLARPSVAVLGFKNLLGRDDAGWISTALSEMLAARLAAGEEVRTVSGDSIAQLKIDLNLPEAESVPAPVMERVRQRLGRGYVVVGSYGPDLSLDARLIDTGSGQTVVAASESGSEANLADLTARIAARFRERLGLSRISELESQGIAAAIPSNQTALQYYAEGLAKVRTFDALPARDLLTRAIAAEPSYPLAHAALVNVWRTLGHDADARMEAKQALDKAGKLGREDHLLVEARYYQTIRNWPKAVETYEVLELLRATDGLGHL